MNIIIISRIIFTWIVSITIMLAVTLSESNDTDMTMYRFGPHNELFIIGICIDTYYKYTIIILYCIINTSIRNISHNVIGSWITLNVQDNSVEGKKQKLLLNKYHAYEIVNVYTLYYWFDWFIYIHLLLAQIDIVIIEMGSDIITTILVTRWYLTPNLQQVESTLSVTTEYKHSLTDNVSVLERTQTIRSVDAAWLYEMV